MKNLIPVIAVFAILLGYRLYQRTRPMAPVLVKWVPLEKAESEAARLGRPIFYDFSADWCTPCRQMSREVFSRAEDASFINEHFIPAQVYSREDVDDGELHGVAAELMQRYKIDGYPTLVVQAKSATKVFNGFHSRERVLEFLHQNTAN